jgi:hypothetical protein
MALVSPLLLKFQQKLDQLLRALGSQEPHPLFQELNHWDEGYQPACAYLLVENVSIHPKREEKNQENEFQQP